MNPLIQEFLDLNRFRCKDRHISHYDSFGSMLQFHINGFKTFKTTLGAFVTLGYYCLLVLIFVYYLLKFFKTDDPIIAWNQYKGEVSSIVNLNENVRASTLALFDSDVRQPSLNQVRQPLNHCNDVGLKCVCIPKCERI